jgi:hypothetical protein
MQTRLRKLFEGRYITNKKDVNDMLRNVHMNGDSDKEYIYLNKTEFDFHGIAFTKAQVSWRQLRDAGNKAMNSKKTPEEVMKAMTAKLPADAPTKVLFEKIKASKLSEVITKLDEENSRKKKEGSAMDGLYKDVPEEQLPDVTQIKNIDNYIYNHNIIYSILKTIIKRLAFGNKICNNRLREGKYINQSLANIRNTISDIVSYKNRETILAIPDIEDNCLEQYKNGCGENCFSLTQKTIDGDYKIDSEIFKDIKNFIKISNCMETYETNDFYDDILVSVFCVANLDKGAFKNSGWAPPTPHIDLNEIYTAFYNYGGLLPGRERRPQDQSEDTDITNNFKKALSNLLIKINYYITEENPKIDNFFDIAAVPKPFKLQDGDDYNRIIERVTKCSPKELNQLVIQLETRPSAIGILEKIENSNSVTTIGTLEFIDKISKYQLTNTICMGPDFDDQTKQ